MKARILLFTLIVVTCLGLIAKIFWEQEYKFVQPTPVPDNLKVVLKGDSVGLDLFTTFGPDLFIHFYNYECPCSRFNIKEFGSLVKKYSKNIEFLAVLQIDDQNPRAINQFKEKYDLGIPIIEDDGKLAYTLGIYSTPQAVIIKEGKIYYKGNYNKARFCLSKNTKFAEQALKAFVNGEDAPVFPTVAEIPYGCELPSNSARAKKSPNLFNL